MQGHTKLDGIKKYSFSIPLILLKLSSKHIYWLFENQVSWKADFYLGTSGTPYPENLGRFFCSNLIALPFYDGRVHPESLGIVMDKKLLNTFC